MKNNGTLKLILAIIGGVVVAGAAAVAVIHFWDDLKKYLPCCKCNKEQEDFADIEACVHRRVRRHFAARNAAFQTIGKK